MCGYLGGDHAAINAQCIVDNHIDLVRSQIPVGDSREYCIECGEVIPEGRRLAWPGVTRCIPCQVEADKHRIKLKSVTKML